MGPCMLSKCHTCRCRCRHCLRARIRAAWKLLESCQSRAQNRGGLLDFERAAFSCVVLLQLSIVLHNIWLAGAAVAQCSHRWTGSCHSQQPGLLAEGSLATVQAMLPAEGCCEILTQMSRLATGCVVHQCLLQMHLSFTMCGAACRRPLSICCASRAPEQSAYCT